MRANVAEIQTCVQRNIILNKKSKQRLDLQLCSVVAYQRKRTEVMSILPGNKAPWFSSIGFMGNRFLDISINNYSDKWLILFFYPLDFGYVSPSELMELEKRRPQLELLNCR